MAFEVHQTLAAGAGVAEEILGAASTQYNYGDGLAVTATIGTKVGATGKMTHIFVNMFTPISTSRQDAPGLTTTKGEKLNCIKVAGELVVLKSGLTGTSAPPINGVACNSNANASQVLVTFAGSSGDFTNGTCYCPEIDDDEHFIVTDTVNTGVHTFAVVPPFRRPPTIGDTLRAVPFAKGATTVKFDATTPSQGIGTAVGDKTGGQNKIHDVDLKNYLVFTTHPDLE